jgi:septum formation protein
VNERTTHGPNHPSTHNPGLPSAQSPGLRLLGLRGGPLVLASRSPRRRELLERLQVPLLVLPSNVAEGNRRPEETPERYVLRLSSEKAEACLDQARRAGAYACLGADTIVEIDGEVLEQPVDRAHAVELLQRIGGRWHEVWTGLSLILLGNGRRAVTSEMSRVFFERLNPEDLEVYLDTGEPMDKAGAYGIQGWGGIFVPRIAGDFFNVMGLPLAALRRVCKEAEEG